MGLDSARPLVQVFFHEWALAQMAYSPFVRVRWRVRLWIETHTVQETRLVAVATQKFIAEVASDALQQCKARQATVVRDKRDKQQKDKRLVLTMEDLSRALHEKDRIQNEEIRLKIGVVPIDEKMRKSLEMVWSCSEESD
uniref:Uncharacterized protein n=1 Tax=Quercus lobata TaxID=97700 RepID=A0A7N2N2Y0_QUELO